MSRFLEYDYSWNLDRVYNILLVNLSRGYDEG